MGGHLGDARITVKNLRILSVDPERNLVALRGRDSRARTAAWS